MTWLLNDKYSLLHLATVKPALQKVVMRAAEISKTPFMVVSGNRTAKQQAYLFAQGRTRPGPKVTWTLKSRHMGGGAIDFSLVDTKGRPSNTDRKTWPTAGKTYKVVADAMKKAGVELGIPVIWGGDWKKTPDWGHIELVRK